MEKIKVLFVAAESDPFFKTGGLGDVIGSLPKALSELEMDVRVVLPKYKGIPSHLVERIIWLRSININLGWRNQFCGIESTKLGNVTFYFLDNQYYFNRDSLYGYGDDGERFSYFCKAALEILPQIDFKPDIIHCHDWQTGMIPVLLDSDAYKDNPFFHGIKKIFTIHNLKFQGIFPKEIMTDVLQLGHKHFHLDGIEFYDQISFMKGGINYSDLITTVSPSYSEEIKHDFYGENLDGLLRHVSHKLKGIINGLDYDIYNPLNDPFIFKGYNIEGLDDKYQNKKALREEVGLPQRPEVPIIAIVSRLTEQKGFPLIERVLEEILHMDIQLIVLGTGEKRYENMFKNTQYHHPSKLVARIGFDNRLAHLMYAGSDMFLMPSLFEPCGLSQLMAMRYGSIHIVRETGGLKDTVEPYNKFTGEGIGFSFENYNAHDMLYTIQRAVDIYYNNKNVWYHLMKKAMSKDYSWKTSALKYKELYIETLTN